MSGAATGNVQNQLALDEHEADASAKRVALRAFDGADYNTLASEPYEGGSKSALAISEEGQTSSYTAFNVTVGTSVLAVIAGHDSRKKIAFRADLGNDDTLYLLQSSGATLSETPYALEPGDMLIDDLKPYNATWWVVAGSADQLLRAASEW